MKLQAPLLLCTCAFAVLPSYIYYLFMTRYPSNLFQSTGRQVDAFQNVFSSVSQVYFADPDSQQSTISLPAGCEGKPSQTFFITRKAQIEPGWQQIMAVSNRAGMPIWQALVKTEENALLW